MEWTKTKEISFPLGGIGTGCIGLSGNGRLIDWEIYNRPNKGGLNRYSHLAVKAEGVDSAGMPTRVLDARILNGDLPPPYSGDMSDGGKYTGFGFSVCQSSMAGFPHFKEARFDAEYPIAKIRFRNETFPGEVMLTAFNPLIPLNDHDSSIPGAFLQVSFHNTGIEPIRYTAALTACNPSHDPSPSFNDAGSIQGIRYIRLGTTLQDKLDPLYGELCIASEDLGQVSQQIYWTRGRRSPEVFWKDFTRPGNIKDRVYDQPGKGDHATLGSSRVLEPGEECVIRFVLTWHYPNCSNYWNPMKTEEPASSTCTDSCCPERKELLKTWRNFYATIYPDAIHSAVYSICNWDRLMQETFLFHDALFNSTLPTHVLDAVSANISILKTPTCLRLEDGSFYGFEGCSCSAGCCEGSCTHVWNYAYALPFLFPTLERSMRDLDYRYNIRENGGMGFRLQLPLGRPSSRFRPCADGQLGGVVKAYRDWKICGDDGWLRKNWDAIRRSLEFAWAPTNTEAWDLNRDGVLEGRQHHTLDTELFGPNSWLTGFYLAALKAGAEMAEYLGEKEKAADYLNLFKQGCRWVDENLFNGEYFYQKIDLKDREIIRRFDKEANAAGDAALTYYWDEDLQEIRFQIGEGCGIDQVVAQWHADLCGLGDIFNADKVQSALQSIYRYNYKRGFRNYVNTCRIYSLNDESGVVICDWPEGKYRPAVPISYSEETMCGFEYAFASHMILRGMADDGLEIVRSVRDRFDGEKRNPWNEFECGSNYARSMASYTLLIALSGFQFDMRKRMIGFFPVRAEADLGKPYSCFFSIHTGWGTLNIEGNQVAIQILYGELALREVRLPKPGPWNTLAYRDPDLFLGDERLQDYKTVCTKGQITLFFDKGIVIHKGNSLVMVM